MLERCDWKGFSAATVAATGPSLFYGAVLTNKAGGASLLVYDHNYTGHALCSTIKLRMYMSDATGTQVVVPPLAVEMDTGIFASLSAGSFGTLFFSKRH